MIMQFVLALLIAVMAVGAPAAARDEPVTIRRLALTCGDGGQDYDKGFCAGYIKALLEFRAAYDNAYRTRQTYCIPESVTAEHLRDRFLIWAREDASRPPQPALWGFSRALKDNYPC